VHLEVDTGMTRGGVLQDLDAVLAELVRAVGAGELHLAGIWSHLACADQPGAPQNARQRDRFEQAVARAADMGLYPEVRHLANSAAALTDPSMRYDLVRCGIASYGLSPDFATLGPAAQWGLRPAMRLAARLALVKQVPAGAEVSYGATYTLTEDAAVAIIPVGYADGIPRQGSGRLEVRSREGLHHVRGRVCMDQIIMECDSDTRLRARDEVTLFGGDGPSADEWGAWAGTIGYDIVTGLGPRVPRRHHGAESHS
jgi:alanine racemase